MARTRCIHVLSRGASLILGGDAAHVENIVYLSGADLVETRRRLRLGLHWRGERAEVFYRATWLDKELVGQPDDQIVGSLRLGFRF